MVTCMTDDAVACSLRRQVTSGCESNIRDDATAHILNSSANRPKTSVTHLRGPSGELNLGAQQGLTARRLLGVGRFEAREYARRTKAVGRGTRGQGFGCLKERCRLRFSNSCRTSVQKFVGKEKT